MREFPWWYSGYDASASTAGLRVQFLVGEVTACHGCQKKKKKRKICLQIYQDLSFRGHRKKVWGAMRELIKHNKSLGGEACVVQGRVVESPGACGEFHVVNWNQLSISMRAVGKENTTQSAQLGTCLVYKNEVRVRGYAVATTTKSGDSPHMSVVSWL